jgi:hypothetical protein
MRAWMGIAAILGIAVLGNRVRESGMGVGTGGGAAPHSHSRLPRPTPGLIPAPESRLSQPPRCRAGQDYVPNAAYDGKFTFVRVRFEPIGGGDGWRGRDVKWDHDYPCGERNFQRILHELTSIRTHLNESNILTLDDPELMKYPVAYMSEPGYWSPSDKDVQGLRTYLEKGGFIIFDDFAGQHWYNFAEQMRRVLPDAQLIPLDSTHPIFDSFFHIESLDFDHPYYGVKAQFIGIFEDNDPAKRMLAIANYNNDIGDYWEWSDEGFLPIALSNQAYRLGVNYVIYAMTH